jgi:hypothetical protein
MHKQRAMVWSGCVAAALVMCAGAAQAKPEKREGVLGARDSSVEQKVERKVEREVGKVVKDVRSDQGASKTVEVSREKTESGVMATRTAQVKTADGITVVHEETRTREKGKESKVVRAGTTVVTNAAGETKKVVRSSTSMREGNKVTRVSSASGDRGTRSATTVVIKAEDGVHRQTNVTKPSGASVERKVTQMPVRTD